MGKFLVKRILSAIPTLLLTLVLIFFMMRAIPGNPLYAMIGNEERVSQEQLEEIASRYNLAGSVFEQFGNYIRDVFAGDWGDSLFMGMSVMNAISSRLECTLMLTMLSMLVTVIIGVPIGILGAAHKNSVLDYSLSTFSVIFLCIPNFVLALGLLYFLAFKLRWFPLSNYLPIAKHGFWKACHSLMLPAFSIGMTNVANVARYTRSSMISIMQRDYIRTAKAKGLSDFKVRYVHAMKNAFSTVMTTLSGMLLSCLGGSVVVEGVFNIFGIGDLAATSLSRRDYALTQAVVLFMALLFIVINILLDIGYKLLDPRVDLN